MTAPDPIDRPSLEALIRRAVALGIELVALHIQSARNEVGDAVGQLRGAVVLLAIATGLTVMCLVILVFTLVLGLAALTGVPAWATGLFLMLVFVLVAGLLAWIGIRRLSSVNFVPEKTIASLNEELEWLKNWKSRS